MITLDDLITAGKDLSGPVPIRLCFCGGAPEGLDVEFDRVDVENGQIMIHATAEICEDAVDDDRDDDGDEDDENDGE